MGGKFVNTKHKQTIDTLVSGLQDILKNPYYKWSSRSATIVTYFNRNVEKSTLDEGAKVEQMAYGPNSPIKYNKIKDFYIYGIEQIAISIENGDFGAEASPVSGEGIILPNTITPYPGDYFYINYTKDDIIFSITGVSHDTLEDGANIYKINYEMDTICKKDLDLNIADTYQMMLNNEGTKFNTIIRSEKYDFIERLDGVRAYLREHFIDVFYSGRIQSFCYLFNMRRFYDPYMIEFLIKNEILQDTDDYIFIDHQLPLPRSFSVDYDRTIFRCFEIEDFKNIDRYRYKAIGRYIQSKTSIFSNRPEDYWKVDFKFIKQEEEIYKPIPCFNHNFVHGIMTNTLFEEELSVYNIPIKYVNGIPLDNHDIDHLEYLEFADNPTLFYILPIIILCIDRIISKMMLKPEN